MDLMPSAQISAPLRNDQTSTTHFFLHQAAHSGAPDLLHGAPGIQDPNPR